MKDKIKEMNFSEMLFNRDERLLDYITNLQEENKRLKEILHWKQIENNIFYKSRNEKAIEYIHNHQPVFELSSKEQIQEWFEKEYYVELLNILQGEDKE